MEIVIYRHAAPIVSSNEIISGCRFQQWVERYNASGINGCEFTGEKERIVYTSNLDRSIETGRLIGNSIHQDPILREAEIPLIKFPAIRLKAKFWLAISRSLWLFGFQAKCESFKAARRRAGKIVERIEHHLLENQRIVIVGHGFLNRLIKKELLCHGWSLKQVEGEDGFLSKMVFRKKSEGNPN